MTSLWQIRQAEFEGGVRMVLLVRNFAGNGFSQQRQLKFQDYQGNKANVWAVVHKKYGSMGFIA